MLEEKSQISKTPHYKKIKKEQINHLFNEVILR